MPLFDKYDVPLVFTAHEHCYERTVPIKNDQAATEYCESHHPCLESFDGLVEMIMKSRKIAIHLLAPRSLVGIR